MRAVVERASEGFGADPDAYRYDVIFLKEPHGEGRLKSVPIRQDVDEVHAGRGVLYFSRLISRAAQSHLSKVVSLPIYQSMTVFASGGHPMMPNSPQSRWLEDPPPADGRIEPGRGGLTIRRRNVRGRRWIHLAALAGLVLTTCAEEEGNSAAPTRSEPVDRATPTVTASPPSPGGSDCSAAPPSANLKPQPGLPDRVEEIRQAIAEATVRCEYRHLEALARAGGEQFTFTFGAAEDPAQFWRREEAAGGEPMKFLAGMLERPYRQSSTGDLVLYVWPSAATYPSWAEVPPEDRNVLRPLYGDEEFEQFAGFGSYIGYRVGITDTGDWLYFVAGD
jgi:hypothetical protein